MNLITDPEQAKRLARTIVSDVAIYNREKVEEGIKSDSLFDLLAAEIEEGRQHYHSRIAPELLAGNYFELALVDILVKRSGKIESSIW